MVSIMDRDKDTLLPELKALNEMGYEIYATRGTSTYLYENGIQANALFKIDQGSPNTLDLIKEKQIGWIINTPSGAQPRKNEIAMRAAATIHGIPVTTTIQGVKAAVDGLKYCASGNSPEVNSIQNYNLATQSKS